MTRGRLLLDTLLEPGAITVVFQPIFECRGRARTLYALECLIRGPKGTNMEDPEVLLDGEAGGAAGAEAIQIASHVAEPGFVE